MNRQLNRYKNNYLKNWIEFSHVSQMELDRLQSSTCPNQLKHKLLKIMRNCCDKVEMEIPLHFTQHMTSTGFTNAKFTPPDFKHIQH